ncbi:MAG: bifunctional diaminohydroxyphosphoribosylaminopyrimidine deaminase/5-amino-6-(5-phosphoribosylamino)uracil reductase RibD [Verrucomicrobia bacterium]|nr:bifunctional diaminohydroxyphosphoribosylaminopyrimidine deaminase/5-amino-6-(5-phosphoribosylamino)uracil reductase RibD [Verrucomicrobiota bacterium]MCH8513547.1 bifunctional diaminohydroxyphosphoribosylaminopyrimidine deaminase/5-amino-6-(5-phosphoribosylamino)uracil reductase RibD [Kiritimatiellia bacterium]
MTNQASLMREALAEAAKGRGLTAPNPAVGAVVVKDGNIVGRGFHAKAGAPHAEPMAIADAGAATAGADLYVTLEPCCTHGRTPPCTEAIQSAGIRRVFVGCTDPNPAHAGRAYAILRGAGIDVIEDVLREECADMIRGFAHAQTTGLPYLTLKLGTSLDGRIADAAGASQWITGPECREGVQELRRQVDAILVGSETLRQDNPSLMPRPPQGRAPWRIVPDRLGRLPLDLKVFTDEFSARTLCVLGPEASDARRQALEALGVSWMDGATEAGHLDWPSILTALCQRGVQHILCEGGGVLAAALLRQNLVREIFWGQAPILLGQGGRPAVAGDWSLAKAPEFQRKSLEVLGRDLWMRFTP